MIRSYARAAQPWIAWLFVACVVVQVFLAGLGIFENASQFAVHRDFGYTFSLLVLVLVILSIAGRMRREVIGLSLFLVVLIVLQSVFVQLRTTQPIVAALHPVNGFLIGLVGIVLARDGRRIAVEGSTATVMPRVTERAQEEAGL
jgi:FlaA1/EpsC-like NDP-sugar epimerase